MIHQPSGGVSGQATDIQIHAEEILYLKRKVNHIYAKHTKQPIEAIGSKFDASFSRYSIYLSILEIESRIIFQSVSDSIMERDRFMSPEQARDFGLIDTVLEQPPVVQDAQ